MANKKDSNNYSALSIARVIPGYPLRSAIYLKINDKFIKYLNEGDELDPEKYNLFLAKNLRNIYVYHEDYESFVNWVKERKEKAVNDLTEEVGEEYRDMAEKREEIKEMVFETFADEELSGEKAEQLKKQSKELIKMASQNTMGQVALAKLMRLNKSVADHSLNVANVSVYLALVCGFGNQRDLETIYLGGIFHDYGKAKIPPKVLENPASPKYSQAITEHPSKGAKMVGKVKSISPQVKIIVEQHHENFNGNGFPRGLRGDDIFKFAKVVSMANIFENTLQNELDRVKREKPTKEMYQKAIKVLEYDQGKQFDPELAERVVSALKLSFSEENQS